MVVTGVRRRALAPALIVPDEQTWTAAGSDPAARGLRPTFALREARSALIPESVPAPLEEALRACLDGLRADAELQTGVIAGLAGRSWEAAVNGRREADGDRHAEASGHHHMQGGHHDMMAIEGDPSADGLVMESIQLSFGPLATPLPGGLSADVTLDGDVVAKSTVHALLSADSSGNHARRAADLLSPVACRLALAGEQDAALAWRRLAALEAERAVSHLAWLRALGRLLGWSTLVDRCTHALEALPPLAHEFAASPVANVENGSTESMALQRPAARTEDVEGLVARSRALRLRAAGLGVMTTGEAVISGLSGPAARASGVPEDLRSGDARYERLGFEPLVHTDGDAYARILQRAGEARQALRLAAAALQQDAAGATAPESPDTSVEGPRGPLREKEGPDGRGLAHPGAEALRRVAGSTMVGAEWSAALVILASFDPSPWRLAE